MSERYQKSEELYHRAIKYIPTGSQTFSKSITQYPLGAAPLFIDSGKGSKEKDVDGNEYIDFVNGLASVSLGYCDEDVDEAVLTQMSKGVTFSLPHVLEQQVAQKIVELVPCADLVRFGKNGSDATSAAIRLARAFTGKDKVAVCGYHGWQDWYIGSTARHLGVPEVTRELTHRFNYNDADSLEAILKENEGGVAAIIMEPMNTDYPKDGFLERVRTLADEYEAILIFDETITGFRYSLGGAQTVFGVMPDLATFGKGAANGLPLSIVTGRQDIMTLMEDIFFSGTFGGETLSLAATQAVISKMERHNVPQSLFDKGSYLLEQLDALLEELSLRDLYETKGHPSWSFLVLKAREDRDFWGAKTLFHQEMFKRGIITLGSHNMSYAHSMSDIDYLMSAYREVLPVIKKADEENNFDSMLECERLEPLFKVR